MRIVYVVPGPMSQTSLGTAELERRLQKLRGWAARDTEVEIVDVATGPASIESAYEEYLSVPATVAKMVELEAAGYDAAILGCAGDPGLDAMREMTSRLYIAGPAESSEMVAAMLGHRFSIVTIAQEVVPATWHQVQRAGVATKLASVRVIDTPVLSLGEQREETVAKVIGAGRACIEQDGCDTIVLGCMSLGFLDLADEVSQVLGVPVVNPSLVALKMAEAMAGAHLVHSKRAYMYPPKLTRGYVHNISELLVGTTAADGARG